MNATTDSLLAQLEALTYEPNPDLTDWQLEAFAMFAICAAGHNADSSLRGVKKLLADWSERYGDFTPLGLVLLADVDCLLEDDLACAGLGCYTRRANAFLELAHSNIYLRTCTISGLEAIHGIGPKTARYIVTYTRASIEDCAILDTHILRFMRDEGLEVPKQTPASPKKYAEVEAQFLDLWREKYHKKFPKLADFDFWVWKTMRERKAA